MFGSAVTRSKITNFTIVVVICLSPAVFASRAYYPASPDVYPGDWPVWRGSVDNDANAVLTDSVDAIPRDWTFSPSKHVWGYKPGMSIWSSPALGTVSGRSVLVVGSYDRNLYMLDAIRGHEIWHFTSGAGVYSTPLIWHDGKKTWVFAASSDRVVYGLRASDGKRLWSKAVAQTLPTTGGSALSSPCMGMVGGRSALFVAYWVWDKSLAHSTQKAGMVALDAEDGKLLWKVHFLDNRVSNPVFYKIDGKGLVFVASEDGNLRALYADTGKLLWYFRETDPILASPLVFDSAEGPRVVIGSNFGKLRCLDARNGKEVWSYKTAHWITGSAALANVDGRQLIIFGSYNQRFYALDAQTGKKVWSQMASAPVYGSPVIIPKENEPIAVFPAWDNNLYAVSVRRGTLLWQVFMGAAIWDGVVQGDSTWASPVAARLGEEWCIYHGSFDGQIYSIPVAKAVMSNGSQPWADWSFWLNMFISLVVVAGLALWLTAKSKKASRKNKHLGFTDKY